MPATYAQGYKTMISWLNTPKNIKTLRETPTVKIQSMQTWASEIKDFLKQNKDFFIGWECDCELRCSGEEHDKIRYQFRNILRNYSLIGYHCTKLTPYEIDEILTNGMSLQDQKTLSRRIDKIQEFGLISEEVANILKKKNQANEKNRAKMIWFCFYKPHLAGNGIQDFFKYWGGEALYNSHDRNPIIGPKLREIGTPCLVKAEVPMNKLTDSFLPDVNFYRAFLKSEGHNINKPINHEGFSTKKIAANNIIDIIQYPSEKFIELTGCNEWNNSPLSNDL